MKLASDHTIVTRHVEVGVPAGGALVTGGVLHAVGSRSEAVRLAMVVTALRARGIPQAVARLVGPEGSSAEVFNRDGLPRTEDLVQAGGSTDVERTAHALAAAEQTLLEHAPAMVVLGGDGDGALAFALAASKLDIPIVRLGAGLRCGDFSLSEEINRTLTDRLANVLFTDTREVADALETEGIDPDRAHHVGSTAIDLLRRCEAAAERTAAWRRYDVPLRGYVLVTLHRPENVRDDIRVAQITHALIALGHRRPVVLPLHPETRMRMEAMGDLSRLESAGVRITEPLGYLDFLSLEQTAGAILTDSGLVQDEASALGVRCYTLRRATERLVTLTQGTNVLLGDDPSEIIEVRLDDRTPVPSAIPLWDGRASERIATELVRRMTLELAS
jgi:UDP-N-acetylglucosamine 2-epimerase (non-hydrolysing)